MKKELYRWLCAILAVFTIMNALPVFASGAGLSAAFLADDAEHYWDVSIWYYDKTKPENERTSQEDYVSDLTSPNTNALAFEDSQSDEVTLQINYRNSGVERTYPAGTVRIYVTNPLYGIDDKQFSLTSVAVSTSLNGGVDKGHWKLETASDIASLQNAPEFVFVNIVPFGNNYNFEGSIQIIFKVQAVGEHHSQNPGIRYPAERFLDYCEHTIGQKTITATLVADADESTEDDVKVVSNELKYEAYRKYIHKWTKDEYTVNKKATELTKVSDFIAVAQGMDEATFEQYYWVRWDVTTNASRLNEMYWMGIGGNQPLHRSAETLKFVDKNIPTNALVYDSEGHKLTPDSSGAYSYEFNLPTRKFPDIEYVTDSAGNSHWYVIVGYPKSDYYPEEELKKTLDNNVEIWAKYIEGEDDKKVQDFEYQNQNSASVDIPPTAAPGATSTPKPTIDPNPPVTPTIPPNIDPDDPGKEPKETPTVPPGETVTPEPGTSTTPTPGTTPTPTPAPTPTPTPGTITDDKWYEIAKESLSEDTKYIQNLTGSGSSTFIYRHRISVRYNRMEPGTFGANKGKLPYNVKSDYGMDVVVGDDYLFISAPDGGYRQLQEDEYYFSEINFPETLYNPYGPIAEGKYTVELYIRTKGDIAYKKHGETFKNTIKGGAIEPKSFTFEKDDAVVAFYFVIRNMEESLMGNSDIGMYNEFTTNVEIGGLAADSIAKSGRVYNINYLKVYREEQNNDLWGSQGWINQPDADEYPGFSSSQHLDDLDKAGSKTRAATTYNHGGLVMRSEVFEEAQSSDLNIQMKIWSKKTLDSIENYNMDTQSWEGKMSVGLRIRTTQRKDFADLSDSELEKAIYALPDEKWCVGWEMYDLLPDGMKLKSSEAQILNSLAYSSYGQTFGRIYTKEMGAETGTTITESSIKSYIRSNTTVTVTEDWKGTGRTYIAIIVDLSEKPIIMFSTREDDGWRINGGSTYGEPYYWGDLRFKYDFSYDYETGYKKLTTPGVSTVYNGLLAKYKDRKGYPESDPFLREEYKYWLRYNSEYKSKYEDDRDGAVAIAEPASKFSDKTFLFPNASDPAEGGERPQLGNGRVAEYKFKKEMENSYNGTLRDWQDINGDENYWDLAAYKDRTIHPNIDGANDINADFMQYWFDHDQYFEYYHRNTASFIPKLAVGSFQSVTKEVSAGTTYFNPNTVKAELGGNYQYRITINTGFSFLDDVVLYDDIEELYLHPGGDYEPTRSAWLGAFVGVEVGTLPKNVAEIKVYYSKQHDEQDPLYEIVDGVKEYNLGADDWTLYNPDDDTLDPNDIHSLAFEFIKKDGVNNTLEEYDEASVIITMKAPPSNDDETKLARNGSWTSWTAKEANGTVIPGISGINSNTVTVSLPLGEPEPGFELPSSGSADIVLLCASAAALIVTGVLLRPKKKRSAN